MGSITNFLENELIDHVLNAAYSPPATVYLALCTSDPGEAATGASMNEVANSNGYARKAITFNAAANRAVVQAANVIFDEATGSWGTVTHWAIVDSATHGAGNCLAYGALGTSKTIAAGNTPQVAAGEVYIEFLTGGVSDYLAHKLLDLAFRNVAYSRPDTYIGLATATVADDDTGSTITEPDGADAYARILIDENGGSAPAWTVATGGAAENADDIEFPTASGDWGTIVASVICDAANGGNLLFYDNDLTDQAVATDDQVRFLAGDVTITLD